MGEAIIIPPALRAVAAPHRAMIEAAFGPTRADPYVDVPDQQFLFLCFTNRCGSNYLAHLLATTGAFNEAGEVFNAEPVLRHAKALGLRSLGAYFAALPGLLRDTGNIVVKSSIEQLVMLADAGILDGLDGRVHFLLLERNDRLGQAISRVVAARTGRFTSEQVAGVADAALVYSRDAISEQMRLIGQENGLFYLFFAANGIVPIHAAYEAVLAEPGVVVDQVAAAMETGPIVAHPAAVRIGRQANAVNEAWRRDFLAGV